MAGRVSESHAGAHDDDGFTYQVVNLDDSQQVCGGATSELN